MLIAFDGSREARRALEYAARLLAPRRVEILTAWEPVHRTAARAVGMAGHHQAEWVTDAEQEDPAYLRARDTCHEGVALAQALGLTARAQLVEADRTDCAGTMRFFWDVLLPLSRTIIAALFVIQFIYGWNQYLWPLLVTTNEDMYPVVLGIKRAIFGEIYVEWNVVMATAILAMLPPALVVILMQKWFVRGLVDTEK